jgi:poly(hydroxyalkanoate) depolymerase family esterase
MKTIFLTLLLIVMNVNVSANWISGTQWSIWGARDYKLYIPSKRSSYKTKKLPIVVAIHGCMQTPESFAGGTRLNKWAEKLGFAVLYPEQSKYANQYSCWNWFMGVNQTRGGGENLIMRKMIESAADDYNLDQRNIFILGISAGAAAANVLANTYPEIFKALASHHGIMYAGANIHNAKEVVYNGSVESPEKMAKQAYRTSNARGKNPLLPTVIIHGSKGAVMNSIHAIQVENEMKAFNDLLDNGKRDYSINNGLKVNKVKESDVYAYEVFELQHKRKTYIKRYMIQNLGHAWSGGDNQWEFNDPHGPDATKFIIEFFQENGLKSSK